MRAQHAAVASALLFASVASVMTLGPAAAGGADGVAAKDPRNFTWVEPGVLAVGGGGLTTDDVDWLHGAGFRAIVDLRAEHQDPADHIAAKGMTFLDMPVDSASHINATMLGEFVAWAREQKAAGRPIYMHCTNGWHRAAAFAVAWEMAEHEESYDEAAREAAARRPGTVMRSLSALLDHEATLRAEPQLAVVLVSPVTRPEPYATMEVHVDVVANGAPAPHAAVRVWSEESRIRLEGVTDANGRLTFTYTAPASAFMDHLYARAHLDGSVDGADNVEFLFGQPARSRGALDVAAAREGDDLVVRATSQGKALSVRVIATAPGWTAFESSDRGVVRFPYAPAEAIAIRVVSWGSDGGTASVQARPPTVDPAPPPVVEPDPAPVAEPDPAPNVAPRPDPGPASGLPAKPAKEYSWQDYAAAYARYAVGSATGRTAMALAGCGLVALTAALYVVTSRKRSGIGSA